MSSFERIRLRVLIFLVSSLSVTVVLKVASIQYLEIIMAADFCVLAVLFGLHQFKASIFRPFFQLGWNYLIFMALALILSFVALDQTFYAANFTLFKRPVLVTVARVIELALDVFYMLYLASIYRKDPVLCRFGALIYYWVGIAGGVFAFVTFPLNYFYGLNLGTYLVSHRLRGFNNEGGSYGTYLISVMLLAVVLRQREWLTRRQYVWGLLFLFLCLVGSQSKAAFFVAVCVALLQVIWSQSGWRRLAVVATVIAVFAVLSSVINLSAQLEQYTTGSALYQKYSLLHAEDGNYVMGRISGAVLAPRMIAARPFSGVGWGNYPLVRDDPQYRQGTAFSIDNVDAPNLGPIDYVVELGIPLWMYLTWLSFLPVFYLRRAGADAWLLNLAMMQPLANWFGAHLNITYPWVVLGFALGLGLKVPAEDAPDGLEAAR